MGGGGGGGGRRDVICFAARVDGTSRSRRHCCKRGEPSASLEKRDKFVSRTLVGLKRSPHAPGPGKLHLCLLLVVVLVVVLVLVLLLFLPQVEALR